MLRGRTRRLSHMLTEVCTLETYITVGLNRSMTVTTHYRVDHTATEHAHQCINADAECGTIRHDGGLTGRTDSLGAAPAVVARRVAELQAATHTRSGRAPATAARGERGAGSRGSAEPKSAEQIRRLAKTPALTVNCPTSPIRTQRAGQCRCRSHSIVISPCEIQAARRAPTGEAKQRANLGRPSLQEGDAASTNTTCMRCTAATSNDHVRMVAAWHFEQPTADRHAS